MKSTPDAITETAGSDVDAKRLQYVFYISTIVGGMVLMLFAYRQFSGNDPLLKYSLLAAASGVWLTFGYVYITGRVRTGSHIASVLLYALILALVYTGGQNNTGLYWIYPLFFIQFIYLGAFRGLAASMVLMALIGLILGQPEKIPADYSNIEIRRSMASLTTLMVLCFISEFFRHRSHEDLSSRHTDKMLEAVTDPLTGLTNRRFLDAFYFPDCRRNQDQRFPIAVILCDLDHFKSINDNKGHLVGDLVLTRVARLLAQSMRSNDVVSRVGGEEFLLLAQGADRENGHEIAEKLRQKIESLEVRELDSAITASFGVAIARQPGELNATIERADRRLYAAKRAGRNRVISATDHTATGDAS